MLLKLLPILALLLLSLGISAIYIADKKLPAYQAQQLRKADRVMVHKRTRTLQLLDNAGEIIKQYPIMLGGNPVGHKQQEGDNRTPEGLYRLDWRNPESRYHLSLHISYPNAADRATAAERGVSPGSAIMLHGLPNWLGWLPPLYSGRDWTQGCIAVRNWEIEEIWRAVDDGTPIEIRP